MPSTFSPTSPPPQQLKRQAQSQVDGMTANWMMRLGLLGLFMAGIAACSTTGGTYVAAVGATADQQLSQVRGGAGLSPLRGDAQLEAAAKEQASNMATAGRMSHNAGASFQRRVTANGIAGKAAENVANGRFSASKVVEVWMNSPPHRRNIMNPAFSRYGLASADGAGGRKYWAMVLAE